MAFVLELQDDYTVKRWEVSLVFPRKDTKPLYIVSNTRSNLFLLQSPPAQHAMLKDRKAYDAKSDKICFQYGVSSKVFSVECAECKVHLLLSPSEISRLFQVFNVIGFVCSYLVSEEGQEHLRSLLAGPASAAAQELCKAASRFFCPSESITGHDFSKKLKEILMDKLREACKGLSGHTELGVMVLCALVALAAADLATMIGSSEQEDSDIEKLGKSFVNTQFNEMVKLFDVEAELLTVLYQGKNIFVVFRNPKTEDWASGATKQTSHGQTISFGLCHKVFSITTAGCEIQFIQNLQETYTMVETFYLPGFAKHLLMSDKWRKKLGRLQKEGDGNGGLMEELSQLAVRFLCVEGCQKTSFTRKLEKQMKEKCTNNHIFPRGGEGLLVLGTLMAIMTAVTATLLNKNDMDDCSGDNGMNETSPAVTAMSMNENDMGALDDFDKTSNPPPAPSASASPPLVSEKTQGDATNDPLFNSQEKFFQELFSSELAAQASVEFEKAMKELAEEEPQLVEQFQKLSEAAGKVGSDETSQQEFTSCLKETLTGLAKNADDLQNSSFSEEKLAKAMEDLGIDESDGEGNILPLMQNIMQNLLSKEVLYPSLKEITEKYPEWLRTHRDSLPAEEYRKYQEQHSIMGKICQQFELEQAGDGEAAQFEAVMDLMQQLQELGHPPKELAGDSPQPPGFNFDLEGLNLGSPGNASGEQCLVM